MDDDSLLNIARSWSEKRLREIVREELKKCMPEIIKSVNDKIAQDMRRKQ